MKYDNLETVLKECEQARKEDEAKLGFELNKFNYQAGWLRSAYERMYNDLPAEMKQSTNEPVNS